MPPASRFLRPFCAHCLASGRLVPCPGLGQAWPSLYLVVKPLHSSIVHIVHNPKVSSNRNCLVRSISIEQQPNSMTPHQRSNIWRDTRPPSAPFSISYLTVKLARLQGQKWCCLFLKHKGCIKTPRLGRGVHDGFGSLADCIITSLESFP